MSLLHAKHRDEKTAALSVALNRASKVRLLRDTGADDLADKAAIRLRADIDSYGTDRAFRELLRAVTGV